jgi:hypothetical protein
MRFSALSFRLGLLLFWALAIAEAISDSARKNLMVLDSCRHLQRIFKVEVVM